MAEPGGRLVPHVPRLTLEWLSASPDELYQRIDGTLVFADLSGFTAMSERLAALGREGAERLTEVIDSTFATLLSGVYAEGGSLLAFGGDAMVLTFTGADHAPRGARAAAGLRRTLRSIGRHETPRGPVHLRISIGMHSGEFVFFLVGSSHRQLLVAGAGVSRMVDVEQAASSGEIVISEATAQLLPDRCVGPEVVGGRRLSRTPSGQGHHSFDPPPAGADELAAQALSAPLREHLLQAAGPAEHRIATIGFVQVRGIDACVAAGLSHASEALAAAVTEVQEACARFAVTFLGADVDHDAVKLLLIAGAPVSRGDDEERMLLALRDVIEAPLPLPVRAGVHRGNVFVGDVGPTYRRTFTAMGDTVNLAARLVARADDRTVLATHDVVDRSRTAFALTPVEPFVAKGKRALVHAVVVGQVTTTAAPASCQELVGRDSELAALASAWTRAESGAGGGVEIVGEPGIGKTVLLDALVGRAGAPTRLQTRGDLYSASSPYRAARILLLPALGLGAQDQDRTGPLAGVTALMTERAPHLIPWLPLLVDLLGGTAEPTLEVTGLSDEHRRDRLHGVVLDLLDTVLDDVTLFTVEDSHWLDDASAALLTHLVSEAEHRRWLVVTTRREVLGGYVQAAEVGMVIRPGPLDDEAASRLVEGAGAGESLTPVVLARLTQQAAGNPLFLRELVAAVRDDPDAEALPDTLDALLTARLDHLGPRDRDLVRRAAVLGARFRSRDVTLVTDDRTTVPGPSSWARLTEFVVHTDDGQLAFTHALLRDVAYATLPFRLRRELHGQVADAWSTTSDHVDEALLSYHFFAARRWADAWQTSRRAGEAAMAAHAPVEAAALFERALRAARQLGVEVAWEDRAEAALSLAKAHEVSGSFAAAERAYTGVTKGSTDPILKARSLVRQAWLAERQSRLRLGVRRARAAERLLAEVPLEVPGRRSCLAEALTVEGTCWEVAGRHDRALVVLRRAVAEADAAGDRPTLAHAGSILDWALAMTGDRTAGQNLQRSLEIYEELGNVSGMGTCLTNLGALAYLRGDWSKAVDYYRQGQLAQIRSGDLTSAALGAANIGEVLSDQGHWDDALASLDEALRTWRSTGHRHGVAYAQGLRGRLLARMDRFDDALLELRAAEALHREVGADGDAAAVALWRAECQVLAGHSDEALSALDAGAEDGSVTAARVRGTAWWIAGREESAIALLRDTVQRAVDESEHYEQVSLAELLGALGVTPDTPATDVTTTRRDLGVLRLAAVPIGYR